MLTTLGWGTMVMVMEELTMTEWPVVGGIYKADDNVTRVRVTAITPSGDGRKEYDYIHQVYVWEDGTEHGSSKCYRCTFHQVRLPNDQGPIPKMRKAIEELIEELVVVTSGMKTQQCILDARALIAELDGVSVNA